MAFARHAMRYWLLLVWCALALPGVAAPAAAEPPNAAAEEYDPFADANRADAKPKPADDEYDPFDDANRAGRAKPEHPSPKGDYRVHFAVDVPKKARPGEVITVTITGTPQGKYYTYPLTQRTREELAGTLSKLQYEGDAFGPLWPVEESPPQFKEVLVVKPETYLVHSKPFTWTQELLVRPTASPGPSTLRLKIHYQGCDKVNCKIEEQTFEKVIEIAGEPVAPPEGVESRLTKVPPKVVESPERSAPSETPPEDDRIAFKVELPKKARPGETVTLTITGTPKGGFVAYPLTGRTPEQPADAVSKITYGNNPDLVPLWPVDESKGEFKLIKEETAYLVHEKPFTWEQDILISQGAQPGPSTLRFTVSVAGAEGEPVKRTFTETIEVGGAPAAVSEAVKARLKNKPEVVVVPVPESVYVTQEEEQRDAGLLAFLLASGGAAFLMLLTPCVFPMIPITVSFFLKQSEQEHHRPLATAAVYSGTIIVVLAAAVMVLGQFIITLANNEWMNLGLGLVLIFFALSLFGMYEIELPHFLTRFTSARQGKGGYGGAVFMALTFTITSFTCTGPFLGPLLVATKELQLTSGKLILGALVYAAVFAAPFFFLALFPSVLKKLPKSGGWMNSIKVVMGFLELAAAFKFLANTDLALNPGRPALFSYDTVLCSWIALSALCGLYLLGIFRLPHDSPVESLSVVRMLFAGLFLGLAVYMVPLLDREIPTGTLGKGMKAFLPPDTRPRAVAVGGNGAGSGRASSAAAAAPQAEQWHWDYKEAWEQAKAENKLLFIDFTGVNCTNCRYNEDNVFPVPAVREQLHKYVLVQLYNDSVPNPLLSSGEAKAQADRNREWQDKTFGDVSTPLYVVFQPAKDAPFEDGRLKGTELGRRAGLINDPAAFAKFLGRFQRK